MAFLGVYRAIYDYAPQGEGELAISEGDLLFVLERSTEDDWWKAKKKAHDDDDDEPEGLIPATYVEEAQPMYQAKALYEYTKQTDEELSFPEEARLQVYDTTDADWTLVGLNGEYGFAPAIYIEAASDAAARAPALAPAPASTPAMPPRPVAAEPDHEPEPDWNDSPAASPVHNPAAALAGIIAQKTGHSQAPVDRGLASPPLPSRAQYTPEESEEEEAPSLPQRPRSQPHPPPPSATQYASARSPEPAGIVASPPYNRQVQFEDDDQALRSPGGFHLYNVSEMVSHMGKNKKMPTTLGINVARGIVMISPAKSRDGPSQEWTAERLTHYSIEGKHVFIELVRPSKSVDLHAGAKDTAKEIVAALGELAGAYRAEGLREVLAATSGTGAAGHKTGKMLYEFMAQGEDEVTVAVDDEVIVLDDTKSDEWWMVRRLRNGKEGVVPSSYVEITGTLPATESFSGLNAAKSTVEQNRLEEERLTREANKARKEKERANEVGPGVRLPERHSSLARDNDTRASQQKSKRDAKDKNDKPKPNASRIRTWTDRSGSFKVEAEFIGLKDAKIHLHKLNGVKIAVPVSKMAVEDLEYVERATGVSLDDDKPLADIKRRSTLKQKERPVQTQAGAKVQSAPDYDWFDFFLQAGVNPQICERYAAAFSRDQMGQEILPDVNPQLLRTLGLKEGDILRVMKVLDSKYGRTNKTNGDADAADPAGEGGLFSGPGGALRNNTRKGRPAPAVQTNDVVDPDAFKQDEEPAKRSLPADAAATPLTSAPARTATAGFDDDAWDLKPSKTSAATTPAPAPVAAPAPAPAPTPVKAPSPPPPAPVAPKLPPGMAELSLLDQPLVPAVPVQTQSTASAPTQEPARTGADPSFFDKLAAPAPMQSQQTGVPRPRPQAPQQMQTGGSLIAPPPRAASAPGFPQQQTGSFAPLALQPQLTGYQAPMGQSLQDLTQQRMQQQQFAQQQQFQPQMTGFPQQQTGFNQMQNGLMPQATGYNQFQQSPQQQNFPQYQVSQPTGFQPSAQQQFMNGQATGSPFADPPRAPFQPQPTGFSQPFSSTSLQPQQTGYLQPQQTGLPPALQPQQTGYVSGGAFGQQNGFGQQTTSQFGQIQPQATGFGQQQTGFGQPPPMPPQPTGFQQPLVPQKTGPAPPIRFGVQPAASRLAPQPTGRRANLSAATPQNPFGF
ncbi:hypothetical protein MBLNU459_g6782t1 [Dothideomycetes sp. NU459]